ncbi:TadE/TadG family type IV pilus assembly protein [Aestuariimicrobium soli]|uniref:TadE/TadG family type IV pilus assembly protein n=1 Tax=Aestuariimicrobium soli TaxID=2035834 RepID=UPI003EBE4A06
MRRLTIRRERHFAASRPDERGAVAVTTALVFVILMLFVAVAINLGALFWDRQQGQNGADSAALALAQTCAKGGCGGGVTASMQAMATSFVNGSKTDANAEWTSITLGVTCSGVAKANTVTVRVSTERTPLAPGTGGGSDTTGTCATAAWGGVGSANVIPWVVSMCNVAESLAAGTPLTIYSKGPMVDCTPSGVPHSVPGGFSWLSGTDADCNVATSVDGWVTSQTGAKPTGANTSAACAALFSSLAGKVVMIPLFDDMRLTGSNAQYHIVAYAAIQITQYCLSNGSPSWSNVSPCNGSTFYIKGTFQRLVPLEETIGGPDFGVTTIQLTE